MNAEDAKVVMWRSTGLYRFRHAQDRMCGTQTAWERARGELMMGSKESHWMWFVFPQGKGLGSSYQTRVFELSPAEARRYAQDEKLGGRLEEAFALVVEHVRKGRTLPEIFNSDLDARKFVSCMSLFTDADPERFGSWTETLRTALIASRRGVRTRDDIRQLMLLKERQRERS